MADYSSSRYPGLPQQPPDDAQPPDIGPQLDPQQLTQMLQGANPIDNVSPPQPPAGGSLQQAMSDYAGWMLDRAKQLSQPQGGAGTRFRQGFGGGMMHAAGLSTPREQEIQNISAQQEALRGATGVQQSGLQQQQLDLQRQMITLPNGATVPLALAKTLFPAYMRADTSTNNNERNNATKRMIAGYNDDGTVKPLSSLSVPQQLKARASDALNLLNKARADALNADPNTGAGRAALAKIDILDRNARANLTKAAAQSGMEQIAAAKYAKDYIDGMQDEDGNPVGINQYKAQFGADKAPAAMLQSAEYARGALGQADAADAAIARLKARGVLGNFAKNKVEDLIFSNGAVDPSLPAEDRKDIGIARAAYGYESSGALRAHTGRSAQEIYKDFKSRLGMGQDLEALGGAQQQTRKLLTDYGNQATRKNIHALRNKPVGDASIVKWGRDASGKPVKLRLP